MKKQKRLLSLLLALVLCLVAALPAMRVGAETEYLSGDWEEATLKDNSRTWDVHAFRLDETLYNCKSFDLEVDISMNYGARCKDWQVWVGYRGDYSKVGTIYLADGDGYASKTIRLRDATTFDAVAIVPTVQGGYSWSFYLYVSNPVTRDADRSFGNYSSGSNDSEDDSEFDLVEGDWESVRLDNASTHAYVFDTPLRRCTQLSIVMHVEMNAGTHCYEWKVWSGNGDSYSELGTISMPDGDGGAEKTFYFTSPRTFESIVITPLVDGNYSYSLGFVVYNAKCK